VAQRLRAAHIEAHFTIGGHYPSLCHDEVLAQMPELDSVTRYEGEASLLELVEVTRARRRLAQRRRACLSRRQRGL